MSMDAESAWSDALIGPIVRHLEAAYPQEGCGLIIEDEDGQRRFQACENVIDKYHRLDPQMYPRTSSDFYMIDPRQFITVEDQGSTVAVIVHSHPDTGDYFSDADVESALMPRQSPDDPVEPRVPGADYLVVSVHEAEAVSAALYRFQAGSGEFEKVLEMSQKMLARPISSKEAAAHRSV